MKDTAAKPAAPGAVLYLTEEAAAARFSVSVNTLRRLRYQGKLRAIAAGPRLIRYSVASLDAYFEALASGGDGKAGAAPKGRCVAWRGRRNLRKPAAKSTGETAGAGND